MPTDAQIHANQANAQHSTGPKTESGKAASCMNNFRFGFTGVFTVLESEDQDAFDHLFHGLSVEHQVKTMTERVLVLKMAQHHWLSLRAQRLQDLTMTGDLPTKDQERQFGLFLRYQTTNDRAFHRCLNDLLKLRAERRRERLDEAALSQRAEDVNKIGFESQKQREAQESRREAAEKRKQDEAARSQRAEDRKNERHKWDILLAEAKVDHQMVLTNNLTLDRVIAEATQSDRLQAQKAA